MPYHFNSNIITAARVIVRSNHSFASLSYLLAGDILSSVRNTKNIHVASDGLCSLLQVTDSRIVYTYKQQKIAIIK